MPSSILGIMLCYMTISSFTPGPGNILALNTMTRYGWRKGRTLILGICSGYVCVQLLCTVVLYELNTFLTPILSILKYIGTAYMVWLAVHIIRSKPQINDGVETASFRTGVLLQLVNVKIYFYITTLLSAYLIPYFHALPQLLIAGIGVAAVGSLATLIWAFIGIKLQRIYERQYRSINFVLGLFLIYCAWNIIRS